MNKQERTYTILRDRIHSGEFQPMARLNIDALSRELGVSPIPVREALRRLEAEGWVRFQPNVGAIVAPVDATTWEQQMVAVAILEGAATAMPPPGCARRTWPGCAGSPPLWRESRRRATPCASAR